MGKTQKAGSKKPHTALKHPLRIVTATSLFDGHDASINIMRRLLQGSGAEVIHLGHNRSAEEIVNAAVQEDAQAIAISSYQGGHLEFFKFVLELLENKGCAHIKVFGGGGGTITPDEIKTMVAYGVTKLYTPEDGRRMGLVGLVSDMVQTAEVAPTKNIDWLKLNSYKTNQKSLAQALTCLELGKDTDFAGHKKDYEQLKDKIHSAASQGRVVGVTGTGGAGKSSFIDEVVLRLLDKDPDVRVAILAVDPTRKKTGGALLGDRLRMNSLSNERAFMRSMATRKANVSLSEATTTAIELYKAAGFNWIFVETGGIGQADISIVDRVDINIYAMTQEYGASTQLEKINMLDYADMVILNKFDKPGSLDALLDIRKQWRRNNLEFEPLPPSQYPVFGTISSRFGDSGVDAAFDHLCKLATHTGEHKLPADNAEPESTYGLSFVSTERTNYLGEIATEVRRYKKWVSEEAEKAQSIDALEKLVQEDSLPEESHKELVKLLSQKQSEFSPEVSEKLENYQKLSKRLHEDIFKFKVRDKELSVPLYSNSLSHNKIKKIATPDDLSKSDLVKFLMLENLPGYFPYTAGVFPFKRTEEDPKRQFAGEGPPTKTNKRFHLLCDGEKAKRLSTAFDSVTLYGEDPDKRPDIYGKIGESGVSVCSLDDAKKLYAGFDLVDPNTSVSMTINGPAPMMLGFFFNTVIDRQVEHFEKQHKRQPTPEERERIKNDAISRVRGTVQADILKEDQAQNTCIFSTPFALRMMGDVQQYFIDNNVRNYYSVSISGYHIAEAGANPISQVAFTLANGFTYVEYYLSRGMPIDAFAPNLSFFFSQSLDPEYAVIGRVARRIWALAMKYRYGANKRSQKLKYHIQTSGRSLHAQEISFNDIRTTLEAATAFMDNCNSLHTNAYDEAVTTPTEESVRRAMAIQLIIAKEFGISKNENPLQGSFFINQLTHMVEEAILMEFERLSARGGVLGAMEHQYQRNSIQEESLFYEKLKHSGELPIVGVNTFLNPEEDAIAQMPHALTRATYKEKDEQIANLNAFKKKHEKEAPAALAKLKEVAKSGSNTFAAIMDASRVCSLGQMSHALYEIGGQYRRAV